MCPRQNIGKRIWRLRSSLLNKNASLQIKNLRIIVYSENSDPMEANESLFSLHARFDGRKTVKLPHKADVLDVFNGKIIARDTDTFTFDAPLHSSWLFYYGKDVDSLLNKLQVSK